jgi:3-hydroxy-9,10-secoandrosta-1,3,5(10)-triene-9,17-dione monooxygenase
MAEILRTSLAASHHHSPIIDELIARAEALRPMLREQQASCEARGYPSEEVYAALAEAGLFKILRPSHFGGYQMRLKEFYRVVIEVARGCPSTGWWFALGAGHNAQIASYFSPEAQARIFGAAENFHAPWSFAAQGARIRPVEGGPRQRQMDVLLRRTLCEPFHGLRPPPGGC